MKYRIINGSGTVAKTLHGIRPSTVGVTHSFAVKEGKPIYDKGQRLAPKEIRLVKEQVDKMLKAGIITPSTLAWSFPVVISRKKDGTPRFCVDFRKLNERMKPERWPIPKIQEVFDSL